MKRVVLLSTALGVMLTLSFLLLSEKAWTHDMNVDLTIGGVGRIHQRELLHEDGEPWKGFLTVNVTNTGTAAWGDFHFQIFSAPGYSGNVVFDVGGSNAPTSSQSGLSWSLSGDVKTLDLYFYGNPVQPNQTAWFKVFTDNTSSQEAFFGVLVYPTPVPIPAASWLLTGGIAGLALLRRRLRR